MLSPRRRSLGRLLHRRPDRRQRVSATALLAGRTSALAGSPTLATPARQRIRRQHCPPTARSPSRACCRIQTGASTPAPSPTNSAAPGTTAAPTTPTGPVPKGLAKFYAQALSWGPCESYATDSGSVKLYALTTFQCARLTVPLAYDNLTGKTVQVARAAAGRNRPARRASARWSMDPGGPGGSACDFVASILASVNTIKPHAPATCQVAQLNKAKFDLVGIDPTRCVGSALPAVQCQTDAEQRRRASRSTTGPAIQADVDAANAIAPSRPGRGLCGQHRERPRESTGRPSWQTSELVTWPGISTSYAPCWATADLPTPVFPTAPRSAGNTRNSSRPTCGPSCSTVMRHRSTTRLPVRSIRALRFQKALLAFATWCAKKYARLRARHRPERGGQPLPSSGASAARQEDRAKGRAGAVVRRCGVRYFRGAVRESAVDLPCPGAPEPVPEDRVTSSWPWPTATQNETPSALLESAGGALTHDPLCRRAAHVGPGRRDEVRLCGVGGRLAVPRPKAIRPVHCWTSVPTGPVPPTLLPHRLDIIGLPKTLVVSTTGDLDDAVPGRRRAGQGGRWHPAHGQRSPAIPLYLLAGDACVDKIGTAYLVSLDVAPAASASAVPDHRRCSGLVAGPTVPVETAEMGHENGRSSCLRIAFRTVSSSSASNSAESTQSRTSAGSEASEVEQNSRYSSAWKWSIGQSGRNGPACRSRKGPHRRRCRTIRVLTWCPHGRRSVTAQNDGPGDQLRDGPTGSSSAAR